MSDGRQRPRSPMNPHFFHRQPDGSVRLRVNFTPEEASAIEEAAGDKPLIDWIHNMLDERARYHVRKRDEVDGKRDDLMADGD